MPTIAARKPCAHVGCSALAAPNKTRCDAHLVQRRAEVQEQEAARGSASARGYGRAWQKARDAFLAENPLCLMCKSAGRITAANEVDHVIPHRGDVGLFWQRSNWQPLCKSCHSAKTAREDGGLGNARR